jgi:hypothetical protein
MIATKPVRRGAVFALALALGSLLGGLQGPQAQAKGCPYLEYVGVRGSGETSTDFGGFGYTVYSALQVVQRRVPVGEDVDQHPIDYPAIPVNLNKKYPNAYRASVQAGKNNLASWLNKYHHDCPGAPVALVGYSQGAHVALDVYQEETVAVRQQIVAVAAFGDPRFNPGQPAVDFGSYEKRLGSWGVFAGSVRSIASARVAAVHSFCVKGDPVCNYSTTNLAVCGKDISKCVHLHYMDLVFANKATYTTFAGRWIVTRLNWYFKHPHPAV